MSKIAEIEKLLETAKKNSIYDNFPLSKEEIAIELLLRMLVEAKYTLKQIRDTEKFHAETCRLVASKALATIDKLDQTKENAE